ncbi:MULTISPECIES: hypothetical protein [unclassified Leptolyngbya]|uniref:hypothetical protein n=1 Tax=unclassified Leptolyngbya TaxID=2650499 RepID=UPI001685AF80|nr:MULTISPECIES: hypothetical protein [unclassified Leptolyngbya]MBD1913360.1 hypothetical protein [Leptolyngbya sp. FACHB-8]MBD2158709.1 hypothetical protein [Leptolyngbya sp. FACHB-16]
MHPSTLAKPTVCISAEAMAELHLTAFVHGALQMTASGGYSGEAAMALLDQAWSAQKLLWKLREQSY